MFFQKNVRGPAKAAAWLAGLQRLVAGKKKALRQKAARPAKVRLGLESLEDRTVPTTFTPTTFSDGVGIGSLRDAIAAANADPGTTADTIQLQSGAYFLDSGSLSITSTAHNLTMVGQGSSGANPTFIDQTSIDRIFQIVNPGTTVTFQNLVLEGGQAIDNGGVATAFGAAGGAILSNGGGLTLNNVVVEFNSAVAGPAQSAAGGAVWSSGGFVNVVNTTFFNNFAQGGSVPDDTNVSNSPPEPDQGGSAFGGALYAVGANPLFVYSSSIAYNHVNAGAGFVVKNPVDNNNGQGGSAEGGGVYVVDGQENIYFSSVSNNTAQGGAGGLGSLSGNTGAPAGGVGGDAIGAGLSAHSSGSAGTSPNMLNVFNSSLEINVAQGGAGGDQNFFLAQGAPGGQAVGGGAAITGGTATFTNTYLGSNTLNGGNGGLGIGNASTNIGGGTGGLAGGGSICAVNANVTLSGSNADSNTLNGGLGGTAPSGFSSGSGGSARGGGIAAIASTLNLNGSSSASANTLQAGQGGQGYPGSPGGNGGDGGTERGGGIFAFQSTVKARESALNGNQLLASLGGQGGFGFSSSTGIGGSGGNGGAAGQESGGGLYGDHSSVTLTNTAVNGNFLYAGQGGDGGQPGSGPGGSGTTGFGGNGATNVGGGVSLSGGSLVASGSQINFNTVQGSAPGGGGRLGSVVSGGGIYAFQAPVNLSHSVVLTNVISSATGAAAASGGGIYENGSRLDIANGSIVSSNEALAGPGAPADGGGVTALSNTLTISGGSSVSNNTATGGAGDPSGSPQDAGDAVGGGIFASREIVILSAAYVQGNSAFGGQGAVKGLTFGAGGSANGGGILVSAGSLSLVRTDVSANVATAGAGASGADGNGFPVSAPGGQGFGGGIFTALSPLFVLTSSNVHDNTATGGAGGEAGAVFSRYASSHSILGGDSGGGGVFALDGSVTVTNSSLVQNSVIGGRAQPGTGFAGGIAEGGGILLDSGSTPFFLTLNLTGDYLASNSVTSGPSAGNSGANPTSAAFGGAVFANRALTTITSSTLYFNAAYGTDSLSSPLNLTGEAGAQAAGGGVYALGGTLTVTSSSITYNGAFGGKGADATGRGGSGGVAYGGGIRASLSRFNVTNSTVGWNQVFGGPGGNGRSGGKGGFAVAGGLDAYFVSNMNVTGSTIAFNSLEGGVGGLDAFFNNAQSGLATGAGLNLFDTPSTILESTIANNTINLPPSPGPGDIQLGAGIWNLTAALNLYNDTIAANTINGTAANLDQGGGVYNSGGMVRMANTIVASNTAAFGPDFAGAVLSSDHDLIGNADGSSGFATARGDQLGTTATPINPLLTPLQNNGGPTWTMALLPGSPAIDKGNNLAARAAVDQRGSQRIVNKTIDIGATEYQTDLKVTLLALPSPVHAGNNLTYTIIVTNFGPDTATNIVLVDLLPGPVSFVSFNGPAGWVLTNPSGSNPASATTASMAPGTSATFTLVVQVSPSTAFGTVLSDTATVAPPAWDPKPSNNSVTVKTTVN